MRVRPAVYVASPLGFTLAGRYFYRNTLLPLFEKNGVAVLDPWHILGAAEAERASQTGETSTDAGEAGDSSVPPERPPSGAGEAAARHIGERNELMLRRCDGVFAVLEGVDVDSGVASEVGFAAALGIPIVGWRSDKRLTGDPIASMVNLQVEHFVAITGGSCLRSLGDAVGQLSAMARKVRANREGPR